MTRQPRPVVILMADDDVMTTSGADEDIARSYDIGADSYVRKPVTFEGLVDAVRALGRYWFEIVELSPSPEHG